MITVDIILPVHPTNKTTLLRAIESVFNQTYLNWCLYLMLDYSINLEEAETIHKLDPFNRIQCFYCNGPHNDNGTFARNRGIELSNSKIITYLDADDVLLSNHCLTIADIFKDDPKIDLVHTMAQCIRRELISPKMGTRMGWKLTGFTTNEPMLGGMSHKRDIYLKTNGWQNIENHDHVLWSEMIKAGGTPFVSDTVTYYFQR